MKTRPFKATLKELQSSTIALVIYWDNTLIKVVTEYLNPLRGEGHASIFITVGNLHYNRCFEKSVSDIHLINFVNKFVNNVNYRQQYLMAAN